MRSLQWLWQYCIQVESAFQMLPGSLLFLQNSLQMTCRRLSRQSEVEHLCMLQSQPRWIRGRQFQDASINSTMRKTSKSCNIWLLQKHSSFLSTLLSRKLLSSSLPMLSTSLESITYKWVVRFFIWHCTSHRAWCKLSAFTVRLMYRIIRGLPYGLSPFTYV
jgi:hypothetical protein